MECGVPFRDRIGTSRENYLHKVAALSVDSQASDAGFVPRKKSKGVELGGGIQKKIAAIELDTDDVVIQLGNVLKIGIKEVFVARGEQNLIGFESCGARQTDEDIVDFTIVAIVAFENVFHVIVLLDLLTFPFLSRAVLIGEIANQLNPSVELTKFCFGGIGGSGGRGDDLLERVLFVDVIVHALVNGLVHLLPIGVLGQMRERIRLKDEFHAAAQHVLGHHVILIGHAGNVMQGKRILAVLLFLKINGLTDVHRTEVKRIG